MTENKGLHHYKSLLALNKCLHAIILMKRISFQPALLVLSFPERHSTYLNLTYGVMTRRAVHIWFDIMSFNNRCLLSGSHLGLVSLMKVLKGETDA